MPQTYSKITIIKTYRLRYNFTQACVEWVDKEGSVLNSIGLSNKGWADNGKEYMQEWVAELDEEIGSMIADFIRYEM